MNDARSTVFADKTNTQEAESHREGKVARSIEDQTAKLPSDTFLWAAGAALLGSLFLQSSDKEHASLFVGQWVAPILILGLYNKLVKVAGSDQTDRGSNRPQMQTVGKD